MSRAQMNNGGNGIGLCDRCKKIEPYQKLRKDGNVPGMLVCKECWDPIDCYRLPPHIAGPFIIPNPRPDVVLTVPTLYESNTDNVYIDVTEPYGPLPQ